MIPLVFTEDGSGRIGDGIRQPSYVDYLKLVADAGVTLAVPAGAKHVLFSPATAVDFFIRYTSATLTSAVYAGSVVDGTALEQNPKLRSLKGVSGLGIISPDGGDLTLSWFG